MVRLLQTLVVVSKTWLLSQIIRKEILPLTRAARTKTFIVDNGAEFSHELSSIVHPREGLVRHGDIQELAQRSPALLDSVFQQILGRYQTAHSLIMFMKLPSPVLLKVAIPRAIPHLVLEFEDFALVGVVDKDLCLLFLAFLTAHASIEALDGVHHGTMKREVRCHLFLKG